MAKKVILLAGILSMIILIILGYYLFFNEKKCSNEECFKQAFEKCSRNSLVKENDQSVWLYRIIGKTNKGCLMEVKLLKIKQGSIENEKLIGETMTCDVSKQNALAPESDLTKCSGLLKEGIQEIIIQKMHSYILKNLGQIDDELRKGI